MDAFRLSRVAHEVLMQRVPRAPAPRLFPRPQELGSPTQKQQSEMLKDVEACLQLLGDCTAVSKWFVILLASKLLLHRLAVRKHLV